MKPLYFSLGWLFFGVGTAGVFLPVLPTTPFMILALWSFSKSSEKFHHWLYNHRMFGPPLQLWHNYRVIPLPAKVISISFMLMSISWLIIFSSVETWLIVLAGMFMLSAAIYILNKPSSPPD